jgi:TIR domain
MSDAVRDAEMSDDADQRPAVIFLSYRRGDTQWAARGIYDRLVDRYGRTNVFRDLDAIPPGARFRDYVERKISESDILILLIGKAWASYADETGRRRLEHPRDPVRLELETALRLGLPIIPVRVEGAPMPTEGDLVPSIVDLLEFNAAEVSDSRWDYDVDRLLWAINETVEGRRRARRAAEDQARRDAEEQARRKAEEQAHSEAEERARRDAEDQARKDAEDQARHEAEEEARRKAEEQARRKAEEQARRKAEEQARRKAEEHARRKAEEQARRKAEEQARRKAEDGAEPQVDPYPTVGQGWTVATGSSPLEVAEQIWTRSWGRARNLFRRRAVVIPATVGIACVMVLVAYLMSARRVESTIMGHLPNDLPASCTPTTDKSATCHLTDGTVVFFRLFDTAAEAQADVLNGYQIAPDGDPCPPSAPPVNTSVCRYAIEPENEKGLAMFSYTAKDANTYYVTRWVPDAEPLLRGEMSTEHANPLDWTTLKANWTGLARTP